MRIGKSTRKLKTISDDRDDTPASPKAGARRLKQESTTDTIRGRERKSERVKNAVEGTGVVARAKAPQILETAIPSGSKVVKGFARRGVNGGIQPR